MDPISNMLIMLKNGSRAGHKSIVVPYSAIKNAIVDCLAGEGYISGAAKKVRKGHPALEVELAYADGKPKINAVKRVSKPSRRVYVKAKDIHPVLGGAGILVVSTPKGILS